MKTKLNKQEDLTKQSKEQQTSSRKSRRSHRFNNRRENGTTMVSNNSPAWYKVYANLFEQATSVSTAHIVGSKWYLLDGKVANDYTYNDACITAVYLAPTVGGFINENSAINRAGENLYNILRGKYTSTVPFEASDIMCYVVAYGNILALCSHIRKLLNCVNVYMADNQLVPEYLFKALNMDWTTERKAYATNKFRFDATLLKAKFLTLPKFMPYFEKCIYMFKDVFFQDTAGTRGDFIVTVPRNIYKFSEVNNEDGLLASGLTRVNINSVSIEQLIDVLDSLLDSLISDESIKQMSGWLNQNGGHADIISAFQLATQLVDSIKISTELPYQIKNAKLHSYLTEDLGEEEVHQDSHGKLVSTGFRKSVMVSVGRNIPAPAAALAMNGIFQCSDSRPSNDDIMINSRFTYGISKTVSEQPETGNQAYTFTMYTDTWAISSINVCFKIFDSVAGFPTVKKIKFQPLITYQVSSGSVGETKVTNVIENYVMTTYSSWLPECHISKLDPDGDISDGALTSVMSRNFNYVLSHDNVIKLHEVALLSEFYQPSTSVIE